MLTNYLFSLAIILVCATTMFAVASFKKDNSIIDIAYGPIFILTSLILGGLASFTAPLAPHAVTMIFLICIWGSRLGLRIYSKNRNKPEDFRYATWRSEWSQHGTLYFYLRSYLQIFILQGLVISVVLLPVIFTVSAQSSFIMLSFVGIGLWLLGFLFESIGDAQLDRFIKNKNRNKDTIMKTGLWRYTRHPNYFGESSMWWGIAFIAFSATGNALVFLSPFLITFLLLYVSGIPMLEKKWAGNLEWEIYKAKTSPFLPLPPKK